MLRRSRKSITGKTVGPAKGPTIKPQLTRKIIRRYHFINQRAKYIRQILKIGDASSSGAKGAFAAGFQEGWGLRGDDLKKFDDEMETMLVQLNKHRDDSRLLQRCLGYITREMEADGSLANYQLASKMGQDTRRGGDSSKILVKWLKDLIAGGKQSADNLTALEIGSLSKDNQISVSGIFKDVTRIDLNNSNDAKGILRQDFMERPIPENSADKFDLISCSLVLNFVPTPKDRGQMCKRFACFLKDYTSGVPTEGNNHHSYLFIVLPAPCITNSRYMTLSHFNGLMRSLGYENINYHEAKKICYFLFQRNNFNESQEPPLLQQQRKYQRKQKLNDGASMNNFSIQL
ncbi:25S rRNA (adenine2142-N1)-methyltransferase KNAG_0K01970 [Huiozyma naganishii CBS 8797]|uniref:25S rRNA adenine-N(1) methyltransferase n=1 Tax=Huiozyma naganishii (strain ATCC MYA-139 / BCRC 22969 / CBS 8797 / KCTC 17520 / NBRC 10181 / NCYC 3082 / Yp74L-3) TaxID=1071383 RepID=J7SAY1_HUIN7|nr:hypothetical protein KNAG_0K01970 [Kazachstania naganishii CBS 8797]CCK72561.1 hypothetical protein KNAG_0K01970 [Kazachstania naganishii CBS 8797]